MFLTALDLLVGNIGPLDRKLCNIVNNNCDSKSQIMDSTQLSVFSQVISYFTNKDPSYKGKEIEEDTYKGLEMATLSNSNVEEDLLAKKAQRLHEAHKMNNEQSEWFKSVANEPAYQFPSQCFLPPFKRKDSKVQQTDFPTSQVAYNINSNCYENLPVHQTVNNPYSLYPEEELYYPEFDNFEMNQELEESEQSFQPLSYLYDNIIDFVENTIVQYICQRSSPSPYRLAGEVLARSKLNPNATEFKPTEKIEENHDEEDNQDVIDKFDKETKSVDENIICCKKNAPLLSKKCQSEKDVQGCSKICDTDKTENSICDNEDETDWLSDDESDWDSEEESGGQCIDIDPAEFEDLFSCPLLLSNLSSCQNQSSNKIKSEICKETQEIESSPNSIDKINKRYFDDEAKQSSCNLSNKCVRFCDDIKIIEEPEEIAEELQNARISDFSKRQADKERMERLIAPILTEVHRAKVFEKLHGSS